MPRPASRAPRKPSRSRARERAEAELHETRARMHERGLADDELEGERERLDDGRFVRDERDAPVAPEDRPTTR